jgi:hypothetical protein
MSDDLRTRIANAITDGLIARRGHGHIADAIMEIITVHIPPIVASSIHAYADAELAALNYHGGGYTAAEQLEDLQNNAAGIANYATTNQRWNGRADE